MTLGDLIKKYRDENSMSMDEFSKKSKLSKGYISMLEKNVNPKTGGPITPSLQTIKQASVAMGMDFENVLSKIDQDVNLGWEDDLPDMSDILIPIKREKVPVIGSMACGEPVYREEDFPAYVAVGNEVKADAAVIARGDSMIGARINNGDIVFIHYQPTVENGEIAAIWVDDGFTIKRVYQYGDTIVLRPENSDYDETIYKEDDAVNIKIIGKAVAFQSDVK